MTNETAVGTVISDQESPTFELVRIKMKAGQDLKPGTLVRIPASRGGEHTILIARIRSAHESNPNENALSVNVRDTLGISANYPREEDSTTIFRLVEADLIEEIFGSEVRAPQTLPNSGANVS